MGDVWLHISKIVRERRTPAEQYGSISHMVIHIRSREVTYMQYQISEYSYNYSHCMTRKTLDDDGEIEWIRGITRLTKVDDNTSQSCSINYW